MKTRPSPSPSARRGSARTNEELSAETRRKLLDAGRRLFVAHGFADTPADTIAETAGLTRGALHYQFGDKQGLFVAVLQELLGQLVERLARGTMEGDPEGTAELERGAELLLGAYGDRAVQQLLLRDGPVVLGWAAWRKLQEDSGLVALLRHALEHWVEAGWLDAAAAEPTSRLLLGALTQAGVAIAEARDRKAAAKLYGDQVRRLIRGFAQR